MASAQLKTYTEEDYYSLSEDVRARRQRQNHSRTGHKRTGAPDWIIEIISPSTASYDYIRKLNLYADAGVREYWIVDPVQKSVHVYFLEQESFKVISYTFQDSVKVNIYEDLWIDFKEFEE